MEAFNEMVSNNNMLMSPRFSEENLENLQKGSIFVENMSDYGNKTRLDNRGAMENQAFRELVGEQSESNGNYQTISEAASIIRGDIEVAERVGDNPWDKKQFLRNLRRSAIKNNVWVKNIKDITAQPLGEGTEHEVYISDDRRSVIKTNSLGRVENPQDFNTLMDRFILHNTLFPDVAYRIIGFGMDSMNNISILLEQPLVKRGGILSQTEIDNYLQEQGFEKTLRTVRGRPVWTDGVYEISDVVPANVFKDVNGELLFIDADVALLGNSLQNSTDGILLPSKENISQELC